MDYYESMKSVFCILAVLLLPLGTFAQSASAGDDGKNAVRASAMDASLFYQLLLGELNVQDGDPGAGFSRYCWMPRARRMTRICTSAQ